MAPYAPALLHARKGCPAADPSKTRTVCAPHSSTLHPYADKNFSSKIKAENKYFIHNTERGAYRRSVRLFKNLKERIVMATGAGLATEVPDELA